MLFISSIFSLNEPSLKMLFSKALAVATLLLSTTSAYNLMGYSNQDCTGDSTNQGGTDVPADEYSPCLRFPWPVKSFCFEDTSDTFAGNSAKRSVCFDHQMEFDFSAQGGPTRKETIALGLMRTLMLTTAVFCSTRSALRLTLLIRRDCAWNYWAGENSSMLVVLD